MRLFLLLGEVLQQLVVFLADALSLLCVFFQLLDFLFVSIFVTLELFGLLKERLGLHFQFFVLFLTFLKLLFSLILCFVSIIFFLLVDVNLSVHFVNSDFEAHFIFTFFFQFPIQFLDLRLQRHYPIL